MKDKINTERLKKKQTLQNKGIEREEKDLTPTEEEYNKNLVKKYE